MAADYDALTAALRSREEPVVTLTFDELHSIVGELPKSARTYSAWWANKVSSQPHARAWLDAGRTASPDFSAGAASFTLLSEDAEQVIASTSASEESVSAYIESTLSLERDLESHLVENLSTLESGLTLLGRQVSVDVGRIDLLAQEVGGRKVVIELKVGEARESAIGQIARYVGWYMRADGHRPRSILIAASFSEAVRYAAEAVPDLQLISYRVAFNFEDEGL